MDESKKPEESRIQMPVVLSLQARATTQNSRIPSTNLVIWERSQLN